LRWERSGECVMFTFEKEDFIFFDYQDLQNLPASLRVLNVRTGNPFHPSTLVKLAFIEGNFLVSRKQFQPQSYSDHNYNANHVVYNNTNNSTSMSFYDRFEVEKLQQQEDQRIALLIEQEEKDKLLALKLQETQDCELKRNPSAHDELYARRLEQEERDNILAAKLVEDEENERKKRLEEEESLSLALALQINEQLQQEDLNSMMEDYNFQLAKEFQERDDKMSYSQLMGPGYWEKPLDYGQKFRKVPISQYKNYGNEEHNLYKFVSQRFTKCGKNYFFTLCPK